jgi:periplasmic divalent cation tolerance protein
MDEIVVALTTVPVEFDARAFARELVESGVAACVTVFPAAQSIYRWQGAVEDGAEQQLVIKSTRGCVDRLWKAIKARHPYEVPEFVVMPVLDGNPDYLAWVRREVTPTPGADLQSNRPDPQSPPKSESDRP